MCFVVLARFIPAQPFKSIWWEQQHSTCNNSKYYIYTKDIPLCPEHTARPEVALHFQLGPLNRLKYVSRLPREKQNQRDEVQRISVSKSSKSVFQFYSPIYRKGGCGSHACMYDGFYNNINHSCLCGPQSPIDIHTSITLCFRSTKVRNMPVLVRTLLSIPCSKYLFRTCAHQDCSPANWQTIKLENEMLHDLINSLKLALLIFTCHNCNKWNKTPNSEFHKWFEVCKWGPSQARYA